MTILTLKMSQIIFYVTITIEIPLLPSEGASPLRIIISLSHPSLTSQGYWCDHVGPPWISREPVLDESGNLSGGPTTMVNI